MGVIEVVVRYQLLWCVCLAKMLFQHPYEAPSSGAGQDREVDLVLCGVLLRLHLPE